MKFISLRSVFFAAIAWLPFVGCDKNAGTDEIAESVEAWATQTLPHLEATQAPDGGFDFADGAGEAEELASSEKKMPRGRA